MYIYEKIMDRNEVERPWRIHLVLVAAEVERTLERWRRSAVLKFQPAAPVQLCETALLRHLDQLGNLRRGEVDWAFQQVGRLVVDDDQGDRLDPISSRHRTPHQPTHDGAAWLFLAIGQVA